MNKVITINLNGVAYQLEEGGYDALRAYLENAARRLEGNPDKDEIITDIEQAIADKFRALLGSYKTVVNEKEVADVLAQMGPVEDDSSGATGNAGAAAGTGAGGAQASAKSAPEPESFAPGGPRRLYRITEGAMIAGVCNGVAAYINVDVTFVRLGFAFLTLLWGMGALIYLILAIIVPEAKTPAEKAAAAGMAATAREFIKRAREGYYEGMKSFPDRESRRAWKRKFRQDMRSWKFNFHRQMHEQAHAWNSPRGYPPPIVGPVFIAPVLSILLFVLVMLMLYAIFSLATAGSVWGLALPAGMPLWMGIVVVALAYSLVAWPLKAARYACYFPGHWGRPHACWSGPFSGLFGLAFVAFGLWLADRYVPHFHEFLVQIPPFLEQVADKVRAWWTRPA